MDLLRAFQDDVDGKEPVMFVGGSERVEGTASPLESEAGEKEAGEKTKEEKGWFGGIFGRSDDKEKEREEVEDMAKKESTS